MGASVRIFGFALSATLFASAAQAACPSGAIQVAPGANLRALAARAPQGASFCIRAGIHRLQSVQPKANQKFYGQGNAVLSGARLITAFAREGAFWVARNQTQEGFRHGGDECLEGRPRCDRPEAFFIDDRPLIAVASKAEVVPGKFFFDYDADKIYFLDDPAGKKVEASVSPHAFIGGASGVVIQGLTVEKYSSPIQHGAIGSNVPGQSWIVRNNVVRLNYGAGLSIGSNSRVVGNFIHDNGELGIGCVGDDILIERNRIARNGFFSGLDPLWEGGGGKCALTTRLIFRNNHSYGNNAYGFWTDIDNIDTLYEDNHIENNVHGGISHEISYRAVIRNNTVVGNGYGFPVWLWGPGILIQNSRDVEVYGNTVDQRGGNNGIALIQQQRGSGAYGSHATRDNYVHHNRIINTAEDQGSSGAIADFNPAGMKAGNNRFDHNTYVVRSRQQDSWAWVDDFYDWETYRQKSGQDAHSTIIIRP
jgi:parallel beta-helix repeat protein